MQILAATDFSTRSTRALRQAGLLAQAAGARLFVTHVVDDDRPEELVHLEKREAERVLAEQMGSMPELRGVECRPMLVPGEPFDGVLKAAAEANADLIVMGSHRKQLLDIFVGTTVERVVRKGSFPVLMVNNEAQREYHNVMVAVDITESSANALRIALSLKLIPDGGATLLHAFVPLAKCKMLTVGIEQVSIDSYVESDRQRARDELAAFLVRNDLNHRWPLRVNEGEPTGVIFRAVSEMRPDLLVLG